MKDTSIPSARIIQESNVVHLGIPSSQTTLTDQGYTYNQAGFSYNQVGVDYGGLQRSNQDVVPMIHLAFSVVPTGIARQDLSLYYLLLESGDYLLQEDGGRIIL